MKKILLFILYEGFVITGCTFEGNPSWIFYDWLLTKQLFILLTGE